MLIQWCTGNIFFLWETLIESQSFLILHLLTDKNLYNDCKQIHTESAQWMKMFSMLYHLNDNLSFNYNLPYIYFPHVLMQHLGNNLWKQALNLMPCCFSGKFILFKWFPYLYTKTNKWCGVQTTERESAESLARRPPGAIIEATKWFEPEAGGWSGGHRWVSEKSIDSPGWVRIGREKEEVIVCDRVWGLQVGMLFKWIWFAWHYGNGDICHTWERKRSALPLYNPLFSCFLCGSKGNVI